MTYQPHEKLARQPHEKLARGVWLLHGKRYATFEEFRAAMVRRVVLSALLEK